MKKLVSLFLFIFLALNVSFASVSSPYTVTLRIKGIDLVVSGDVGEVIDLDIKIPEITGWNVKEGGVTITDDEFIMPESNVVIEAIMAEDRQEITIDTGLFVLKNSSKIVGEPVVVQAITNTNDYYFGGWDISGMTFSPSWLKYPISVFSMPSNPVTFTINYYETGSVTE